MVVFAYGEFGEIRPLRTDTTSLVRLISDTS